MLVILAWLVIGLSAFGATYISAPVYTFGSIADMVKNGNPKLQVNGFMQTVQVQGYYHPGDGGGGKFMATNTVTGTNFGTLIASGTTGYSWKRIDELPVNVKWFGAKGDGSPGDNAFITNAYASMKAMGGTLFFPAGTYQVNLAITNSGIIISGGGSSGDRENFTLGGIGTIIKPWNTNTPAIKFGTDGCSTNGMCDVLNCEVRDMSFVGGVNPFSDCAANAIVLGPGAQFVTIKNCSINWFQVAVDCYADATEVNQLNVLDHVSIRCPLTGENVRGIHMAMPDSGETTYCTALQLVGECHIYGNENGYCAEVDSTQLYLGDSYLDGKNTSSICRTVLLSKTKTSHFASNPQVVGGKLDGGGLVVEVGYLANTNGFTFGNFCPDSSLFGSIRFSTLSQYGAGGTNAIQQGTTGLSGSDGYGFQLNYPTVFGVQYFRPPQYFSEFDGDSFHGALTNYVYASAANGLTLNSGRNLDVNPASGFGLRLLGDTPTIYLFDNGNNTTATIASLKTNLTITPPGSGSLIVGGPTGAFKTTSAGNVTANSFASLDTINVGGVFTMNGDVRSSVTNTYFRTTNQFYMYSKVGLLVSSEKTNDTPGIYVSDPASGGLLTIQSGSTNGIIVPPGGSSGTMVIAGLGWSANANGGIKTHGVSLLNLTASRALYLDSSTNIATGSVTDTELGYVNGVTNSIQTQLNSKATVNGVAKTVTASTPLTVGKMTMSDSTGTNLVDGPISVDGGGNATLSADIIVTGITYSGSFIQANGVYSYADSINTQGPLAAFRFEDRANSNLWSWYGNGTARLNLDGTDVLTVDTNGNMAVSGSLKVSVLSIYANNAAAIAGGLTAGKLYRTGADPDVVCVVH